MQDLLEHLTIRSLLNDIDETSALVERMRRGGSDPAEVRQLLNGMYVDLGREVHAAWAASRAAGRNPMPPIATKARDPEFTDVPDAPLASLRAVGSIEPGANDSWYTEEVELQTDAGPLFAPGESVGADDVPGRLVAGETDEVPLSDDFDPEEPLAGFEWPDASLPDSPSWLRELEHTLDTLTPPPLLASAPAELPVELTRVQWAISEVEDRGALWPRPVKATVLALLGSRARALAERSPTSEVRPGLMLDRLRRLHRQSSLPPVHSLLGASKPWASDWSGDAARWWSALVDGLRSAR
jgi:hypothetical protein